MSIKLRGSQKGQPEDSIQRDWFDEKQSIILDTKSPRVSVKSVRQDEFTYDQKRIKMKLNYFNSALLFFQSTVGISWFTMHQPLAKVGLYLGLIIMIVVIYVTVYGLTMLDEAAVLAERDTERVDRIKNAEELCRLVPLGYMAWVKWIMMMSAMGMMMASSVSNICVVCKLTVHLANTLEHGYHVPEYVSKLIIFAIISVFLIIIVEPEGIEVYTYITMTFLTFLGI